MIAKPGPHRTRVGKRNQVTIPAAMLRELGVSPGQQVEISIDGEEGLRVTAVDDPLEKLRRFRQGLALAPVSTAEIVEMVHEARAVHAAEVAQKLERAVQESS